MTTSPSVGPWSPSILPPQTPAPRCRSNEQAHRAYLRRISNDTAADDDDCIESVPGFGTGPKSTATRTE